MAALAVETAHRLAFSKPIMIPLIMSLCANSAPRCVAATNTGVMAPPLTDTASSCSWTEILCLYSLAKGPIDVDGVIQNIAHGR